MPLWVSIFLSLLFRTARTHEWPCRERQKNWGQKNGGSKLAVSSLPGAELLPPRLVQLSAPNHFPAMNSLPRTPCCRAFTKTELLVVLAVMFFFALFVLPEYLQRQSHRISQRINCVNNLKQIGTSFRLWAGDNGDAFPTHVSTNLGGAQEPAMQGEAFRIFQVMSNELNTPKIIVCPHDTRPAAYSFAVFSNAHLSYFVSLNATEAHPQMLLAGDRNLELVGRPVAPGIYHRPDSVPLAWTKAVHRAAGNVLLADGSVQQLANQTSAPNFVLRLTCTNRLVIP